MTLPTLARRALVALGIPAVACTPPAPAQRQRAADHSAPAEDQTSAVPVSNPSPAGAADPTTTTTDAPTTTLVVTTTSPLVVTPTTVRVRATTTTLPERADEDLSDVEWARRERILACIRRYEGDYGTATGNGHWGAYQFTQSTWDGAAARAGYPQWVGRRASDAPAHVQDDVAWQLYTERGFQPWPPATRYCRG